MRRATLPAIALLLLLLPSICPASYLVTLKSGRQFIVDHYWSEEGNVRFYWKGGVIGFPKSAVSSIGESSEEPQNLEPVPVAPSITNEEDGTTDDQEESGVEMTEPSEQGSESAGEPVEPVEAVDPEEEQIRKDALERAMENLRDAQQRGDDEGAEEARRLILDLQTGR